MKVNRHPRHYALFERNRVGGLRWNRITTAYTLKVAVVLFRDRMLHSVLNPGPKEIRLRPTD